VGAAEELFDFANVGGAGVGGKALDENFSILFFEDAVVEQDEEAAVVEGADEASEALLEGDDGGGDGVVEEAVAAIVVDGFAACLDDGVAGDGEGDFIDDDAAQLVALDIDSLPEGRGGKQDGVGGGAELLDERGFGRGALQEHGVVELSEERVVNLLHLSVAGEEAEGAAAGDLQKLADADGGLGGEVGVARVGHVWRNVEDGLGLVVEVGGDDEFASAFEAEAGLDVVEAVGNRESGRSEDDRFEAVKERLAENG